MHLKNRLKIQYKRFLGMLLFPIMAMLILFALLHAIASGVHSTNVHEEAATQIASSDAGFLHLASRQKNIALLQDLRMKNVRRGQRSSNSVNLSKLNLIGSVCLEQNISTKNSNDWTASIHTSKLDNEAVYPETSPSLKNKIAPIYGW